VVPSFVGGVVVVRVLLSALICGSLVVAPVNLVRLEVQEANAFIFTGAALSMASAASSPYVMMASVPLIGAACYVTVKTISGSDLWYGMDSLEKSGTGEVVTVESAKNDVVQSPITDYDSVDSFIAQGQIGQVYKFNGHCMELENVVLDVERTGCTGGWGEGWPNRDEEDPWNSRWTYSVDSVYEKVSCQSDGDSISDMYYFKGLYGCPTDGSVTGYVDPSNDPSLEGETLVQNFAQAWEANPSDYTPVFDEKLQTPMDADSSNTMSFDIAASTSDPNTFVADDGSYVTFPDTVASDLADQDLPVLDESSLSDITAEKENGRVIPVGVSLGQDLVNEGLDADARVTHVSGSTATWEAANGQAHVTNIPASLAQALQALGVPTVSSGAVADAATRVEVGFEDPGFDDSVPVFDTSLDLPDRKPIPFADWQSSVPFLGALSAFDVDYSNEQTVVAVDVPIGDQVAHMSFDFSDFSHIFSYMGAVIYSCASFLAIRYAIYD